MTSRWNAYVDESMRPIAGVYLMAAACVEEADIEESRRAIVDLARPGGHFHWRRSSAPSRAKAVGVVAGLAALHLVVMAAPLDPHRQERARRYCLQRLLFELGSHDVDRVVMETRTQSLNKKDGKAIDAFRAGGIIGPDIAVEYGFPAGPTAEPLLWVPDIVAGAIGAELDRGDSLAVQLSSLVTRYHIRMD